jgi:hypothetical protein
LQHARDDHDGPDAPARDWFLACTCCGNRLVANEIGELSTRRPGKPSGDKTVGKRCERQVAKRLFDRLDMDQVLASS